MSHAFTNDQLIEHAKRRLNYSRCGCRISDSDRALDEALIETAIATLECRAVTAAPAVQAEQQEPVSQPYTLPDGYALVPIEPTEEMLAAAKEWTGLTRTAEIVYSKMIAAAPQQEEKP